jgi:hypothetical protein
VVAPKPIDALKALREWPEHCDACDIPMRRGAVPKFHGMSLCIDCFRRKTAKAFAERFRSEVLPLHVRAWRYLEATGVKPRKGGCCDA